MIINHNLNAMNAHRQLGITNNSSAKAMEKLSSGLRINRAGDDAAGLSISEKMRGQIRGLNQASRNAQDGISLIQTAEGALNETHAILQRMRELATQSATDTNTADDRAKIQAEVDQLAKEITRISNTTEFNTQNLMAGGFNSTFHIGANQDQNVGLKIAAMDAYSLGVAGTEVVAGTFNADITTITGTSNHGTSLTAQTYKIVTTVETVADNGTLNVNGALEGGAGSFTGTYTGDVTQTLTIRIKEIDSDGNAKKIDYKLGSNDWVVGHDVTDEIAGTGLTWTGNGTYTNNDILNNNTRTVSTTLTAAVYGAQLQDEIGFNIGNKALFAHSATSAVIGNAATGETMKISFSNGVVAGTATQVITTVGSQAATVGTDGTVTQKATVAAGINVSSQSAADKAITIINKAIETVSSERSKLGAMQNRLEHTINNLDTSAENLQASESRIRDVDMAKEMMEFTKNNILQQAAQAMLAQANSAPQGVLQLLR